MTKQSVTFVITQDEDGMQSVETVFDPPLTDGQEAWEGLDQKTKQLQHSAFAVSQIVMTTLAGNQDAEPEAAE